MNQQDQNSKIEFLSSHFKGSITINLISRLIDTFSKVQTQELSETQKSLYHILQKIELANATQYAINNHFPQIKNELQQIEPVLKLNKQDSVKSLINREPTLENLHFERNRVSVLIGDITLYDIYTHAKNVACEFEKGQKLRKQKQKNQLSESVRNIIYDPELLDQLIKKVSGSELDSEHLMELIQTNTRKFKDEIEKGTVTVDSISATLIPLLQSSVELSKENRELAQQNFKIQQASKDWSPSKKTVVSQYTTATNRTYFPERASSQSVKIRSFLSQHKKRLICIETLSAVISLLQSHSSLCKIKDEFLRLLKSLLIVPKGVSGGPDTTIKSWIASNTETIELVNNASKEIDKKTHSKKSSDVISSELDVAYLTFPQIRICLEALKAHQDDLHQLTGIEDRTELRLKNPLDRYYHAVSICFKEGSLLPRDKTLEDYFYYEMRPTKKSQAQSRLTTSKSKLILMPDRESTTHQILDESTTHEKYNQPSSPSR